MAGPNRRFLGPTAEFPSLMTGRLTTMREGGILTDFTITTYDDEQKLPCHKLVLSIHSPYFEAMFTTDMVEAATSTVHYDDITLETMRLIIEYCYHEQIDFPDDQLMPLIEASDFFQMERLHKRFVNEVKSLLNPENVLQYLDFAVEQSQKDIKFWCMQVIVKSFPEVAKQPAFLSLTYAKLQECLTKVIQSDVKRDDLLSIVSKWIDENEKKRGEYLEELLQQIEPEKCSVAAISHIMETHKGIIASNLNVVSLLAKSISNITAQKSSESTEEKVTEKQLVITGYTQNSLGERIDNECWSLDIKQNKSRKLCDIPFAELSELYSMCEIPEGFALTGGRGSDMCVVFVASIKGWRRMPKMLRRRYLHSSVSIKGKLYVLCGWVFDPVQKPWGRMGDSSGEPSASVDCLTLESGQWESMPDAPIDTQFQLAAELNGKLLMLVADTNQLLQFDVENKVWTNLASFPDGDGATYASMTAVNGQLCVAGGYRKICAWYNPATDVWSRAQQTPGFSTFRGSLVQLDTTTLLLLCIHPKESGPEVLNIADGSWSQSKFKMPAKLSGRLALYMNLP